ATSVTTAITDVVRTGRGAGSAWGLSDCGGSIRLSYGEKGHDQSRSSPGFRPGPSPGVRPDLRLAVPRPLHQPDRQPLGNRGGRMLTSYGTTQPKRFPSSESAAALRIATMVPISGSPSVVRTTISTLATNALVA